MKLSRRTLFSDLFILLFAFCIGVGFFCYGKQFFGPLRAKVDIDLTLWHLPLYSFFSLSRALSAYCLSLVFSVTWGFWAAKDRAAEKVLIPLVDVLQSIPILGFLPGVVLFLVSIFKTTNVGLEIAAIVLMFTSQAWNMTFGVYHAVRTVPEEKNECATAYGLSLWQRVRWVEFPFASLSLVWNSIMSMAGGWFFLMVNEAFKLGDRDFRLPGLGSYMSVAASQGDVAAMVWAVLAMIGLIVFLDQLLWRPLVVWSQKFRIEETAPATKTETWFLTILKHSLLIAGLQKFFGALQGYFQNRSATHPNATSRSLMPILSKVALIVLLALLIMGAISVARLLSGLHAEHWGHLCLMVLLTLCRVCVCLLISILIALPLGLSIGLSEKWSNLLEPVIQVGASFPASLLFPAFIVLFKLLGVPLGIGSAVLMFLGSFWYVFFNVIAGAKAMPSDLRGVVSEFAKNRTLRTAA